MQTPRRTGLAVTDARSHLRLWGVTAGGVAVDLVSKSVLWQYLAGPPETGGRVLDIVPGIVRLVASRNPGIVFGINFAEWFHLGAVAGQAMTAALTLLTAGLIFYVEQYDGTPFHTFFDAFYYSVVTLTTVGFGDIVPVSPAGRGITLLMIAAGVAFIPWQVKNLIGHFVSSRAKAFCRCTGCGLDYHERDARFCKRCGTPIETGE